MILYIFYNADILDIPNNNEKDDALGYVDDTNIIVVANNFHEITRIIEDMMTQQGGGQQWSIKHNSYFSVPKSAIGHYSRKTITDLDTNNQRTPLLLLTLKTFNRINNKLMRWLYLSVALPKIMYGIETWYTPPDKPLGQTKNTVLVGALHSLEKAQRIAALAITGTLRTTPNDYIDAHTAIFPIELALLKACHSTII